MPLRSNFTTDAEVFRSSYVGDISSYSSTGNTYCGFFQPVDPDDNTIALRIQGQAYSFHTDGDADIVQNDKLLIDGVEYRVRGVRRHFMGSQDFKVCVMELPNKE